MHFDDFRCISDVQNEPGQAGYESCYITKYFEIHHFYELILKIVSSALFGHADSSSRLAQFTLLGLITIYLGGTDRSLNRMSGP